MSDTAVTESVRTFCRVCEPSCGLVAEVADGQLVKLRPDREHPVTEGFACHKGLAMTDLHHDPDRLDHPMIRDAAGQWQRATWDEAIRTVVARLDEIRAEHGSAALGAYTGNPLAFNALGGLHIGQFHAAAGIRRRFSSGTQDCANKFVASEAVFGSSLVHPIPDIDHTDFCLIIGENPRASQASFFSVPNVIGRLRRRAAEGARFVFVNPRRIETSDGGIGDTVQLRPDTDVWFLAALLHRIDQLGGFDEGVLERHGSRVAELREFLAPWSPERVAPVTGVDPGVIDDLARAWIAAPGASVHASTGINMGRQGTLAYWLVHMLSFVTGRLDVRGGNLKSDGFFPNAKSGAAATEQMYVDGEFGRVRAGNLPGTMMSDHILDSADPIRAMMVWAGNPLLSIAGEARLAKAFEQLDFLVVVDIYPSATSEYADVMLPAADMYEREDLNIVNIGTSHRPFAQFTPAVVEPAADRRPEWWVAQRLIAEMGQPSVLDDEQPDPWGKWRHLLAKGSGVALDELREDAIVALDPARARRLPRSTGADRRWAGRLLPAGVRRGDRAMRAAVRGGARRVDRAALDPQARRVDAQFLDGQPRSHEARRSDQQPTGHQRRRCGAARYRRRRSCGGVERTRCGRRDRSDRRRSAGRRGLDGARLGARGEPVDARRERRSGDQSERAAADGAGQLRTAVEPSAHDRGARPRRARSSTHRDGDRPVDVTLVLSRERL